MSTQIKIPIRSEVDPKNTWDLSKLFPNDEQWEKDLLSYEKLAEKIPSFKGTLGKSPESLLAYFDFYKEFGILGERLGSYCYLRQSEDEGDSKARTMTGRFVMINAKASALASWANPEIQAIPESDMEKNLCDPRFSEYKIYLKKLLRKKPYILSEKEERIIALHAEAEEIAEETFSVLTNVDMDFGTVETNDGKRPLSQSSLSVFLENPDRNIRKNAYEKFYSIFDSHKTTLASLYSGSVKQDVVEARVRGFPSARAAHLFPDDVPETVYDNLVSTISDNLSPLHKYYSLRKKLLKLEELRHYDVYVPIVPKAVKKTTWDEAVDVISKALNPLGQEYVDTLFSGLSGRWADRYENKGKIAGAFSSGGFTSDPYILMNYKEDSIRDLFTLAHEGGHSMHTWYSARSNPFMHYRYTIFEAEVASTFNEELLFRYLKNNADNKELKVYLINKRIDDLLATLYRQTMFAEFEKRTHGLEEAKTPLTVDVLRKEYRELLTKYFGPEMVLEETSDLEGLRIPHFYHAFYVYKYSTGISASLALAERVLSGGNKEREEYFTFLKSGGSCFPIESLKRAGVDMSSPEVVKSACNIFKNLVEELELLL